MSLSSLKIQISEWAGQNISLVLQDKKLLLSLRETDFVLEHPIELDESCLTIEFLPNDGFQIKHQRKPIACFLENSPYAYANHTVFSRGVFPERSEKIEALHFFDTQNEIELSELTQYENLKQLSIHHSNSSTVLPILPKLESIQLQHCEDIIEVYNLEKSEHLSLLKIQWCPSLKILPRILPPKIDTLYLEWCQQLSNLCDLTIPDLRYCSLVSLNHSNFSALTGCTKLETLNISWFKRELILPDLSRCLKLRKLQLRSLPQTRALPLLPENGVLAELDCSEMDLLEKLCLQSAPTLQSIYADGCRKLETLDIRNLTKLRLLSLLRVPVLEKIIGLETACNLQELDLSDSKDLFTLEGLNNHPKLQKLSLNSCISLQALPSLEAMPCLESLKIYSCAELSQLRSERNERLQTLMIGGCRSLQEIPDLAHLPNLETLAIAWFHGNSPIRNISVLKKLRELRLSGHSGLRSLQIHSLTFLEKLDLSRCRHLENLETSNCLMLQKIIAQECHSLRNLLGLEKVQSLQEVILSNCQSLENIDFIYYQPQLQVLDISGCQSLKKTPFFHELTLQSLKILNVSNRPYPTDLSKFVSDFVGIEILNIEGTSQIYDYSPLIMLRNLKELHGLSPSEKDHIFCQIFLKFGNIGAISSHLQQFFISIERSTHLHQFARDLIEAMDMADSPLEHWKTLFNILQKKERFSIGDSPITETLWQLFFQKLDQQNFSAFKLKNFFSSHSNFEQEGNCLRSFLFVLFEDSRFDREEASLLLEQTYLQSSPIQQRLYQVWRDRWRVHLPDIE